MIENSYEKNELRDSKIDNIFSNLDSNEYHSLSRLVDYIREEGPLESIIALGHNWSKLSGNWPPENGNLELSIPSKTTAIASYLLYRLGLTKSVILSGGKTAGERFETESGAMKSYISKIISLNDTLEKNDDNSERFERLDHDFIREDNSIDTYTNALETKNLIREKGWDQSNLGLMSVSYHINQRAEGIFKANGVDQIKIPLESEILLEELIKFIWINMEKIRAIDPELIREFHQIRLELRILNNQYEKYINNPIIKDEGKLKPRAHGPEYHFLAKIFQMLTRDPTGEKLHNKAKEMRRGDTTSSEQQPTDSSQ